MKVAMPESTSKSISEMLRFRLTLIRNWALGQARGLRGLAEATFKKLKN